MRLAPIIAFLFLPLWVNAQPQAPAACAEPLGCTMRVDTLRTPSGATSYVHKAWVESPESYLQVWADPRTNSVQHWHRRWPARDGFPSRRACGIRGVTTTCRGKESLEHYKFPER